MLLGILTMTYAEKVLVMMGSKIIDRAMGIIMKGELAMVTATWRQNHFSVVMSGSLQLALKCTRGDGNFRKETPPPTISDTTVARRFCLDNIQRHIHTTWRVTFPLFGTMNIHSQTNI